MKKKIMGIALVVCMILVFTSCAKPKEEANVLTDMTGASFSVPETVNKIVSLTAAGTETVFAMGQQEKLVGIDAFSNYPSETANIEVVGDFNGPDAEKIVALEPDIVLASTGLQKDAIENLKKMGINVAIVEASEYSQIPEAITLMGVILGTPNEAKAIIENIKKAEAEAKKNVPAQSKTMYYAISYGDMGNWTSGPGSFINTMIEMVGGTPTTKDAEYMWIEYQIEDLVTANPDIIMVASDGGDVEGLKTALGYKDLDAIKNGAAYQVDADVLSRPGPRIADAIKMLSDIANK